MKTKMLTHKMRKSAVALACIASMCMPTTVGAAVDNTADVTGPAVDISAEKTEECVVSATAQSEWTVTIPKHITLDVQADGNGTANYDVSVKGKIDSTHQITVTPDASFTMTQGDSRTANATVTQTATAFDGKTLTLETPSETTGSISATGFVAGAYEGTFNFNIAEAAK